MCSTAKLLKGEGGMMYCECPKCEEIVYVYENDASGKTSDGDKEYFVRCDECGTWFNTSLGY